MISVLLFLAKQQNVHVYSLLRLFLKLVFICLEKKKKRKIVFIWSRNGTHACVSVPIQKWKQSKEKENSQKKGCRRTNSWSSRQTKWRFDMTYVGPLVVQYYAKSIDQQCPYIYELLLYSFLFFLRATCWHLY